MSLIEEASKSIHIVNSLQSLINVRYSEVFNVCCNFYMPLRPIEVPQSLDFFVMESILSFGIDPN